MAQSKRWCFTVNNPMLWRPEWNAERMDYLVWQLERGAEGTMHVQGYMRLKARGRMATAKGLLCQEAHLEPAKGTEAQNKQYCSKADTRVEGPFEFGTFDAGLTQGRRTELKDMAEDIAKNHLTMDQVADRYPWAVVQFPQGTEKLVTLTQPKTKMERSIHTTVLWGGTGTGKTHRVFMSIPTVDLYVAQFGDRDPWATYRGQSTVLLDEFDWNTISIQKLKKVLDKWPIQLDSRFYNKIPAFTTIYITCQLSPDTWYPAEMRADRLALMRRLTEPMGRIVEVKSQEQEVEMMWWPQPPPEEQPAVPAPVPPAPAHAAGNPQGAGSSSENAVMITD